jgi:hypothetical protein
VRGRGAAGKVAPPPAVPMPSKEPFSGVSPVKRAGGLTLYAPSRCREKAPGWAPEVDAAGGGMLPLLPGGGDGIREKGMNRYTTILLGLLLLVLTTTMYPAWALDGAGIGNTIAAAIKDIILQIFEILKPIVNIIGIGMVLIGLLLGLGLRQEFLGFRLAIGGGLALLTVHIIVPLLLTYV